MREKRSKGKYFGGVYLKEGGRLGTIIRPREGIRDSKGRTRRSKSIRKW